MGSQVVLRWALGLATGAVVWLGLHIAHSGGPPGPPPARYMITVTPTPQYAVEHVVDKERSNDGR